jgi:hypothetical protein
MSKTHPNRLFLHATHSRPIVVTRRLHLQSDCADHQVDAVYQSQPPPFHVPKKWGWEGAAYYVYSLLLGVGCSVVSCATTIAAGHACCARPNQGRARTNSHHAILIHQIPACGTRQKLPTASLARLHQHHYADSNTVGRPSVTTVTSLDAVVTDPGEKDRYAGGNVTCRRLGQSPKLNHPISVSEH